MKEKDIWAWPPWDYCELCREETGMNREDEVPDKIWTAPDGTLELSGSKTIG